MIGSTVIRAHQYAAVTGKMWKLVDKNKSWGDTEGGFSSKLRAACDALGNLLKFFVTAGQGSNYSKALDLIDDRYMEALIADRSYDANYVVGAAKAVNVESVTPSRSNRKYQENMIKSYIKRGI